MTFEMTEDLIDQALAANPEVMDTVVTRTFEVSDLDVALSGLRAGAQALGPPFTISSLLLDAIEKAEMTKRFLFLFLGQFSDLVPPDLPEAIKEHRGTAAELILDNVPNRDVAYEAFGKFMRRAGGFRCRILKDDVTQGSGALISARLVMTAAHVVGAMAETDADAFDLAPLQAHTFKVQPGDGFVYPARVVWASPCLKSEEDGDLPTALQAAKFSDVALLQLFDPIGREYGHIAMEDAQPPESATELIFLVHYPEGQTTGLHVGVVSRADSDIRSNHSVVTSPGSSGGPGFCRKTHFVGIHQGKWQGVRRLVPYARFSKDRSFRKILDADVAPQRLWSLTDRVDGHFIIGRDRYFSTFNTVQMNGAPSLRGTWIRRRNTDRAEGIGFSYEIAKKYLSILESPHILRRINISAETHDLFDTVYTAVFNTGATPDAQTGVRPDETTQVANGEDRARHLAHALATHAANKDSNIWLYFEDTNNGMDPDIQLQFEHLVREMMLEQRLFLIIGGFEDITLDVVRVESTAALHDDTPALIDEYLNRFTEADVKNTLQAAVQALGLGLSDAQIAAEARKFLVGIDSVGTGIYDANQLQKVAARMKASVMELQDWQRGVA